MAEDRRVDDVGILRMDANARHGLRIGQARVLPSLARVDRFVDATAVRNVAAHRGFARSDVDDVMIGRRDGDRADG